jgi:hypothetical protein
MSHIAKIELVIKDLQSLKEACKRLGFEFMPDQKTYKWYGTWVGDAPMPEGIAQKDWGKCDHAIRVPGVEYEIGVVTRNGKYLLLWDSYFRGGLEAKIGKDGGLLKQAYAVESIKKVARLKNYRLREVKTDQGIRLTLCV